MSRSPYSLARAKRYKMKPFAAKSYTKKRNSKKNPIADGYRYYKSKCTMRTAVKLYNGLETASATPDLTMVGFARYAYGNNALGLIRGISSFDQTVVWLRERNHFKQYAVTGMRVQWMPAGFTQMGANQAALTGVVGLSSFDTVEKSNNNTLTMEDAVQSASYRVKVPDAAFDDYISNRKYAKQLQVKWFDSAAATGTAAGNGGPLALRNYVINTIGLTGLAEPAGNALLGHFIVTWYITWRGLEIIHLASNPYLDNLKAIPLPIDTESEEEEELIE